MLFRERRLGLSLLAALFSFERNQLARGLWFRSFLMCSRLTRHASPLARDLSISQHAQLLAILRKMRNSLDRMEHAKEVCAAQPFVIERGVPSGATHFLCGASHP
jgi:hypothetical protein